MYNILWSLHLQKCFFTSNCAFLESFYFLVNLLKKYPHSFFFRTIDVHIYSQQNELTTIDISLIHL